MGNKYKMNPSIELIETPTSALINIIKLENFLVIKFFKKSGSFSQLRFVFRDFLFDFLEPECVLDQFHNIHQ